MKVYENPEYNPEPCCKQWSFDKPTQSYYCKVHMTARVAPTYTWLERSDLVKQP